MSEEMQSEMQSEQTQEIVQEPITTQPVLEKESDEDLKERLDRLEYKEALIEGQKVLQDFCKQRDASFDYELTKKTFLEKIAEDPSIDKRYGYGEAGAFQFWLDFVKPNVAIMAKKPQAPARFKELEQKAKESGLSVDEQTEYLKMLENY